MVDPTCEELDLANRRAWFVYEAARLENSAAGRPINPEPWLKRDLDFRDNMVRCVALQCGPNKLNTPEEIHDEWVKAYEKLGWKYGPVRDQVAKTHPDMVPFNEMLLAEAEKDWVFFMLCEIAAKMR